MTTNKCQINVSSHICYGELKFKGTFSAGSVILYETLTPGYAMLMSSKQDETAVHGCHSTGTLLCAYVKVRPDRGDV